MSLRQRYRQLCKIVFWISSIPLLLMLAYTVVSVLSRYLLGRPIPGAIEATQFLMLFIIFLAMTYVQVKGSHMRVDTLVLAVSKRVAAILNAFSCLVGMALWGGIAYFGFQWALRSLALREITWGEIPFPIYYGRFALAIGSFLLTVQFIFEFIDFAKAAVKKEAAWPKPLPTSSDIEVGNINLPS